MSNTEKTSYVICCQIYPDKADSYSLSLVAATTDADKAKKLVNDLLKFHWYLSEISVKNLNTDFFKILNNAPSEFSHLKGIYPSDGSESQPDLIPLTDGEFFWIQEIPLL